MDISLKVVSPELPTYPGGGGDIDIDPPNTTFMNPEDRLRRRGGAVLGLMVVPERELDISFIPLENGEPPRLAMIFSGKMLVSISTNHSLVN